MMIQQHNGVVVDAAGFRQSFAELLREGEARGLGCAALPPPTIYRVSRGGAPALGDPIS